MHRAANSEMAEVKTCLKCPSLQHEPSFCCSAKRTRMYTYQCTAANGAIRKRVTTTVPRSLIIPREGCLVWAQLDQAQGRCSRRGFPTPTMLNKNTWTTMYSQNFSPTKQPQRVIPSENTVSVCSSIKLLRFVEPASY